jgi:hypothetical protein
MTRRLLAGLLLLFAVLAFAACGDDDDTATPSPRTGIGPVDAIVRAVEAGDVEALVAVMGFAEVACAATPEPLALEPPCDGAPDGSLVQAFPAVRCEGAFLSPARAERALRQEVDLRSGSRLYGVYDTTGSLFGEGGRSFLVPAAAAYVVVLAYDIDDRTDGWALLLSGDRIVGVDGGCAESPKQYVETGG